MRGPFVAACVVAALAPFRALACDGPAAMSVAISTDGQKVTVTDIGRQPVDVSFQAWGTNYDLQLAPGQSGTPINQGINQRYMSGYQTCYARITAPVR